MQERVRRERRRRTRQRREVRTESNDKPLTAKGPSLVVEVGCWNVEERQRDAAETHSETGCCRGACTKGNNTQ